jgi:hypothetical protein
MTERPPHLVTLVSFEDGAHDEPPLRVVWELERGAAAHDQHALPSPANGFDQSAQPAAFSTLSVVQTLSMPQTNLLIADDMGLGKTIEAGLAMQELMLRHRLRTMPWWPIGSSPTTSPPRSLRSASPTLRSSRPCHLSPILGQTAYCGN